MNDEFTKIKLAINVPFDKPNRNGTIFTKAALEKAIKNMHGNIPIIHSSDRDNSFDVVVGYTEEETGVAIWDFENQICKIIVDGNLFDCGIKAIIKEIENNKISSFEIVGLGIEEHNLLT